MKSDKLYLTKQGRDVIVAETVNTGDKENLVFGNYDRDVIIRTKGSLRIQVQNKFYDLLSSESSVNGLGSTLTIDSSTDAIDNSIDGFHFVPSTGELYLIYEGVRHLIIQRVDSSQPPVTGGGDSNNSQEPQDLSGYLSYYNNQTLTNLEIETVFKNLKYLYDGISSLPINTYEGHIAFAGHNQYKYVSGKWEPLFLSLTKGGIIKNKVGISKTTVENNSLLGVYGESFSYSNSEFNGLLIAKPSKDVGLALYASGNDTVIQSITNSDNSNIIIRTTSALGGINEPVRIRNTNVGFNRPPEDDRSISAEGYSSFQFLEVENSLTSKGYNLGNSRSFDLISGAAIYKSENDDGVDRWMLEVDRIVEKDPVISHSLEGISHQKLITSINYIQDIEVVSETASAVTAIVIFSRPDLISEGDILLGAIYAPYDVITNYIILEIVTKGFIDGDPAITASIKGLNDIYKNFRVVKIGNKLEDYNSVLIDPISNNIKAYENVNNLLDALVDNKLPSAIEIGEQTYIEPTYLKLPQDNIVTVLGDLEEIVDEDFQLENNKESGFYSTNAYIKGKAHLSYLKLGNALVFENDTLVINLEEANQQLSEKIIRGVEGLHGSGKITDQNEAIEIKHNKKAWVNKPNLTGNQVIANLIFDEYGHVVDWVIRELNIPSGGSGGGSGGSGGCNDCGDCDDC